MRLRRSGGGVVPQGPGILNLSLSRPCDAPPGVLAESVYEDLCQMLAGALARLGIAAVARPVSGSFCDGRFNLAVVSPTDGQCRKIAGTAQYWRHGGGQHAVLAHALLIVDAEPAALTAEANRFEAALGTGKSYDPNALTSVAQAWREAHPGKEVPIDLSSELRQSIVTTLTQRKPTGDSNGSA